MSGQIISCQLRLCSNCGCLLTFTAFISPAATVSSNTRVVVVFLFIGFEIRVTAVRGTQRSHSVQQLLRRATIRKLHDKGKNKITYESKTNHVRSLSAGLKFHAQIAIMGLVKYGVQDFIGQSFHVHAIQYSRRKGHSLSVTSSAGEPQHWQRFVTALAL